MNFWIKIHDRLVWLVKEIVKTFSDKPSFFSRKRIESCILFLNAMVLLDTWCYKNWNTITADQIMIIFGAQMVYAGYQITQIRKDVQMMKESENKTGNEN